MTSSSSLRIESPVRSAQESGKLTAEPRRDFKRSIMNGSEHRRNLCEDETGRRNLGSSRRVLHAFMSVEGAVDDGQCVW